MITFSQLSKIFEGAEADTQHQSLAIETVGLLAKREGGLHSLIGDFEQNSLGHLISSWIGNGNNLAITEEQVGRVLGSKCIADLAKKAGIAPEKAAGYLTTSLPTLVDALTPNGKIDSADAMLSRSREILAAFIHNEPVSTKGVREGHD